MGCNLSMQLGQTASFEKAVKINASYQAETKVRTKVIVLGTSNSGKSTLLRQMQLIRMSGFSESERHAFVPLISDNIIQTLHTILVDMKSLVTKSMFDDIVISTAAEDFERIYADCKIQDREVQRELLELGVILWRHPSLRQLIEEHKEAFENGESLLLLFDHISEIASVDYLPSDRDILNCRMRSTGIKTLEFDFDEIPIAMIDVGGQRSERRKWIHYFDNVEVLLFCVSINEYNMVLTEDSSKNAMEESLEMFKSIINSVWFRNKPVILFLNKIDLLEKKLKTATCLRDSFPEFTGDASKLADVVNFIQDKYLECDEQKGRPLFPFQTCATDTTNIEKVFQVCFHMVFRETLADIGL